MTYTVTALNGLVVLKYIMTGGDEIKHYETLNTIEAPLPRYLKEILNTGEWGEIHIYNNNINVKLEYSHGHCINYLDFEDLLDDGIVKDASYFGGWTYGHWELELK